MWQVGVPDLQDRTLTLQELQHLIKSKRVLETDLVLKQGDVWKMAKDYGELMDVFEPGTQISDELPVKVAKPSDPQKMKKTTQSLKRPDTASARLSETARQKLAEAARKRKTEIGKAKVRPMAATEPPPPPAALDARLHLDKFTLEDLARGLRGVLSPRKLLICSALVPVAVVAGLLFSACGAGFFGYFLSSFVFVSGFSIVLAVTTFVTRCELEGTSSFARIGQYLRNVSNLALLTVGGLALLVGPTLFLIPIQDVSFGLLQQLLLHALVFLCFAMYLAFIMSIACVAAALAVEGSTFHDAVDHVRRLYRRAFRRLLVHSAVTCLVTYSLFWLLFSPVLLYAMAGSFAPIYASVMFGLSTVLVTSVLGTASVMSYVFLTHNAPPEVSPEIGQVIESGPKLQPPKEETTQMELPVASPEPPPPPE